MYEHSNKNFYTCGECGGLFPLHNEGCQNVEVMKSFNNILENLACLTEEQIHALSFACYVEEMALADESEFYIDDDDDWDDQDEQ